MASRWSVMAAIAQTGMLAAKVSWTGVLRLRNMPPKSPLWVISTAM